MKVTFEQWMQAVDNILEHEIEVSHDDLADQPYYVWFEEGVSPKVAAKRAMKADGYVD